LRGKASKIFRKIAGGRWFRVVRVPFEYTLIDKRHRPFVEGKRDVLLSFVEVVGHWNLFTALVMGAIGLWFLVQGISGLAYGFSVREDWLTADATITTIVPIQSGDRFNWHYLYSFRTADGISASGSTVQDRRDVFREGQVVPVQYLQSNPEENALLKGEGLSKNVLYWVLVGIGLFWVVGVVYVRLRHGYRDYRALQQISRAWQIVPGEITDVSDTGKWYKAVEEMNYEVEYKFLSPLGSPMKKRDPINILHVTKRPEPGMKVAVFCVGNTVAILL
jgi:hypothetical protein